MASVTLRAFAKINLSLRVSHGTREGFHDVQTVLQAITLFDHVTCEARRGPFAIRCDMPGVPTDRSNLVWKAAQLLWETAGRSGDPANAVVTLQKNIPMQAGLGGGSSDAAAALIGLRKLWKMRVPDERIHVLASRLGSDVPFFLVGGTALGLGRGDEVYRLEELPKYWVVLAIPPFGVATADAYRWFDDAEKGDRKGSGGPTPLFGCSERAFGQRPRGPGRPKTSRNCPIGAAYGGERGPDGGDVGERLDGIRRVFLRSWRQSRRADTRERRYTRPDRAVSRQVHPSAPLAARLELARKSFYRLQSPFALRWSSHA